MSVYVVIGSKHDINYASKCIELLDKFEIEHRLLSLLPIELRKKLMKYYN